MISKGGAHWHWRSTETSPAPQAAVAHGDAAMRLLMRLQALPSERREKLSATAAPEWLVVMGSVEALPWVDGVRYAAPNPHAGALWLPTHAEPDTSIDLLWQALERRHGRMPLLLWPDPAIILPLDRPLIASDELLSGIATAWGSAR